MKKTNTRMLVESAVLIAIGTVLSLFKIDLPFGGGVTIVSMLPLVLVSHRYGWKWGLLSSIAYSLLQLVLGLDNVKYAATILMAFGVVFLDYIIAYTVIGLSGVFDSALGKTRKSVMVGVAVTFFFRFLCHYITGVWIWGEWMPEEFMGMAMTSPWIYSFLYNGWYMLAETILTELVVFFGYPVLGKYFRADDLKKA